MEDKLCVSLSIENSIIEKFNYILFPNKITIDTNMIYTYIYTYMYMYLN